MVATCTPNSLAHSLSDAPRLTVNGHTEIIERPNPPHVAQPLIQTIVDELHGGKPCASSGTSAVRAQTLMDLAVCEYYGSRDDGFWNKAWPGAPAACG